MLFSQRLPTASRAAAGRRAAARSAVTVRAQAPTTTVQAPPAPKTGHHTVADQLVQEALGKFFPEPAAIQVAPTTGGVNNVCQYITTPSGERYILRVYNNGNNSDKVRYEHEVLAQLQEQQAQLSFQVPKALPALNGANYVQLSSGAECCVFHIIPGSLAKTTSPSEVGRATGELCTAMSKVRMDWKGPIAPYYELFKAHWAVGTREKFYDYVATEPEFNVCREEIDYLVSEIRALEPKLLQYENSGLPKQVIHADLHFDNVMVVSDPAGGDRVSGLLDFEFCVFDWRAMECAVALSKYVGEANPLELTQEFVSGYAQHGELSQQEIEIMPDLINLRIFSNVVYFSGRAIAKEDGLFSLTSRAPAYTKRVKWVNANRQAIIDAISERMNAIRAQQAAN